MMTLDEVIQKIRPVDQVCLQRAQARLDRLTKPVRSLGRLEELATLYAAITREERPKLPRSAIFTFAADHGVTEEGISAYPRAVTAQMVLNFLRGGAGVNVLASHVGTVVRVVDIGRTGVPCRHCGPCGGHRGGARVRPVTRSDLQKGGLWD